MSAPRNAARGEAVLQISGRPYRLCVTLGALAELEAAFDVLALTELGDRLKHMSAADLVTVVSILTCGGGEALSVAEVAAARIEPAEAARAVAQAFQQAFGDDA